MGERHTEEMRLLGLTIAFYRRARGLTQSELAEAVQISRTHMRTSKRQTVIPLCL